MQHRLCRTGSNYLMCSPLYEKGASKCLHNHVPHHSLSHSPSHSHWDKLRRLIPGRSTNSGKHRGRSTSTSTSTRGRPQQRDSGPSARLLSSASSSPARSPHKAHRRTCCSSSSSSTTRGYHDDGFPPSSSSVFWDRDRNHSSPSVCSSVVIGKKWDHQEDIFCFGCLVLHVTLACGSLFQQSSWSNWLFFTPLLNDHKIALL